MKKYTGITFKYLKVQKKRTTLTLLGIILSVALITSIGTMIVSIQNNMLNNAIKETGNYHAIFKDIPGDKVKNIQNHTGVALSTVVKHIGFGALSKIENRETEKNSDFSLPPYKYLSITALSKNSTDIIPVTLKDGRMPSNPHEIAVDYTALNNTAGNLKIGDTIKFDIGQRISEGNELDESSFGKNEEFRKTSFGEYTIVGIIDPKFIENSGIISRGYTFLDNTIYNSGKYNIYVKIDSNTGIQKKIDLIAVNIGLQKTDDRYNQIDYNNRVLSLMAQGVRSTMNSSLMLILAFMVLMIITCTIAVIYNSFNISVLERTSQFGILRCTGAAPGQIRKIVWVEAGFLCIICIPLGYVFGILAMKAVMYVISLIGYGSISFLNNLEIIISVPVLIISTILGVVTVFIAAMAPARYAGRVSPMEAIRNTGSYKKENFSRVKKTGILSRILNLSGQIAFKNLRRNRKRFRVTVFSMIISIVLFIVAGGFADSILGIGATETNIGVDYTLQIVGNKNGFTEDQFNEIKSLKGVEDVYKNISKDITAQIPINTINKRFAEIFPQNIKNDIVEFPNCRIIAPGNDGLNELKKYVKDGKLDEKDLNSQNGVVILQTSKFYTEKKSAIMDVTKFNPGDSISVTFNNNLQNTSEIKKVKVLGVLSRSISAIHEDYTSNNGIYLITTEKVYKNLIGDNNYSYLGIKLKDEVWKDSVKDYLTDLSSKDPKYLYYDIVKMNNDNKKTTTTILIFIYGFVGVITLIGCLNIINTLSTNLILRKRELSMLRAVGMTRASLNRMVGFEGILYGITALLYGTVIGTFLSYVLFKIMGMIREYQWTVPWKYIIISIIGVLFVTIVSSLIPLRRISRQNIIENIRMEE